MKKKLSKSWISTALSLSYVVVSECCKESADIYDTYLNAFSHMLWNGTVNKYLMHDGEKDPILPNLLDVFVLKTTFYENSHFETSRCFVIQKSLLLFPYPYNLPKHFSYSSPPEGKKKEKHVLINMECIYEETSHSI